MVDWHPRSNAYPLMWELRNGRWNTVYGTITRTSGDRRPQDTSYELRDALGNLMGQYTDADEAAVIAWETYLEESRTQHERAARRQ